MNQILKKISQNQDGNVLFLILIAVALFAALSYAVTQSTRGGGDASRETSLINSATVTQFPASIRTSIVRMLISNGVDVEQLEFNAPSDFSNCTGAPNSTRCVFHPDGGGASYQEAPADVSSTGSAQEWVFNGENEVYLIGSSNDGATVGGSTTADILAILPNVTDSICNKLNEELGINSGSAVAETGIDVTTLMDDTPGGIGAGGGVIGGTTSGPDALNGESFGCFSQGGANYYYHVLVEQ